MNDWPTLLDLFSKAGGTSAGYFQAGFRVVCVDKEPQPNNPFEFIQADAFEYLSKHGHKYDVIAASPPCQIHSSLRNTAPGNPQYIDLIEKTRSAIMATGKPYVIENVVGSPLINPIMLCGRMFDLLTFRHRLFESNLPLIAPPHPKHENLKAPRTGRQPKAGEVWSIYGHFSGVKEANLAMGIGWMIGSEMAEAIPPAYTRHIGNQIQEILFRKG